MPPKSKAQKPSTSGLETAKDPLQMSSTESMPPPPNPSRPPAILEPEMNALALCLKNTVIKTGQIYGFHADSRRLGLHKYTPYPPRSLTAALGREVEKYDQLCDAVEFQVLRAISVLQRDLAREQRRIREVEIAALATRAPSKSLSKSPTSTQIPLSPATESTFANTDISNTNAAQVSPPASTTGRRQSAISLSSLHRPPFPLKLDLSSSSLRMTAEEAALFSKGLVPSPVSLAPKSARPSANAEMELMAAFASATAGSSTQPVDIDLTVPSNSPIDLTSAMDIGLGSSADKPIELDLDGIDMEISNMNTDLFGDPSETGSNDPQNVVDSLFSPPENESGGDSNRVKQEPVDMDILGAMTMEGSDGVGNSIFASLNDESHGAESAGHMHTDASESNSTSMANIAPSPGTLLASFAASSQLDPGASSVSGFDFSNLDLSNLSGLNFEGQSGADMSLMDMEELLNMGQEESAGSNT